MNFCLQLFFSAFLIWIHFRSWFCMFSISLVHFGGLFLAVCMLNLS